ncbi:MAG: hypothetical protein K2Q03_03640 [Sphingobacteriaceae bacterium]|nr:hypothetical protein [Sphingobacteriaceae bacterium]
MESNKRNKNEMSEFLSTCEVKNIVPVPAKVVAEVVGCSVSLVKKVRTGLRSETKLCKKIVFAEQLISAGINQALKTTKKHLK